MIAEYFKPFAIELAEPALNWNLPVGMVAKKAADDAYPHSLARLERRGERRIWKSLRHNPAHSRPVKCLQISIVATLVGQIERLARANRSGEIARHFLRSNVVAKCCEAFPIALAPPVYLRLLDIEHR